MYIHVKCDVNICGYTCCTTECCNPNPLLTLNDFHMICKNFSDFPRLFHFDLDLIRFMYIDPGPDPGI